MKKKFAPFTIYPLWKFRVLSGGEDYEKGFRKKKKKKKNVPSLGI